MEHCTRRPEYGQEKRKYFSDDGLSSRDGADFSNESKRHDYGMNYSENQNVEWNNAQSFHGNNNNFQNLPLREREEPSQSLLCKQAVYTTSISKLQPLLQHNNFPAMDQHSYVNNRHTASPMSTYGILPTVNTSMNSGLTPSDAEISYVGSASAPINRNTMASGREMVQSNDTGMNPYAHTGIGRDNNTFGMSNYGSYPAKDGQKPGTVGIKKQVVRLTKCVLYPPNSNAPPSRILDIPLGCKTVFVGGMPDKMTEEITREVFEGCGEILTIHMKKNFCHITFSNEAAVKNAIYFSGYKIKIEYKDDSSYSGRLLVAYATLNDTEYEQECQQRAREREARHRDRKRVDTQLSFSEFEATRLCEKLREEKTFVAALSTLMIWLKKGECNKRTAGTFYSMIQSTNSNIRRLMNEKLKYEDELNKAKMILNKQMSKILLQFQEINELFNIATLPKAWDHFTKTQRKNIDMWKKQAEEIRNSYTEELLNDRVEDDMELCQDEETPNNEKSSKDTENSNDEQKAKLDEEMNKLKEQNDILHKQLEAAENETIVLKTEKSQELVSKDCQIEILKQALENKTNEMTCINERHSADEAELKELRAYKTSQDHPENDSKNAGVSFNQREARLFGLVYSFLNIHPFGAYIYEIWTYVNKVYSNMQPKDLESFLKKFPSIFQKVADGTDSDSSMKWKVLGFH